MDMQTPAPKLGIKERYRLLTRDLGWEPTYQSKEAIFPYTRYEGIKIHDWDRWEDPFRLTMDAYWKYQAEKERKYYAILDYHAQNNRSEEHTSELQSLMRRSYAALCLKTKPAKH